MSQRQHQHQQRHGGSDIQLPIHQLSTSTSSSSSSTTTSPGNPLPVTTTTTNVIPIQYSSSTPSSTSSSSSADHLHPVTATTATTKASSRRRNAGQKVRTGCITCKIRRVKCDEGKPRCQRCLTFGVACDGYPPVNPRRGKIKPVAVYTARDQVLLPKVLAKPDSLHPSPPLNDEEPEPEHVPARRQQHRLAVLASPRQTKFANEQEYRYFRLFADRTAHTLAGYVNDSLWDRMILQACEQTEMVRHAVIAIGALDRTMDSMPCKRFLATETVMESSTHHHFALKQYGKAIRKMSEALAQGKQDIRTALIVCLLTICFESFDGNIPMAVRQIRTGLNLIREWNEGLSKLTEWELKPGTPDRELIHVFERLENHASIVMEFKQVEFHDPRIEDIQAARDQVPKSFTSPAEASMYFESVTNCTLHWVGAAYAWGSPDQIEEKFRSVPDEDGARKEARMTQQITLAQQHEAYLDGFRYWYNSFEPLLNASQKGSHHHYVACMTLKLRYKAMYTTLKADHFHGEMCYDDCIDEYREVVELAGELMRLDEAKEDRYRAKFTFDGPILSSLYIVIMKCRDLTVRRKAMALLTSRPRREAILDSTLTTKIAALQMQIEEESRIGDSIPEHGRIRGIKTAYNIVEKTGRMSFLKMIPGMNRKFVKHRVEFSWDSPLDSV